MRLNLPEGVLLPELLPALEHVADMGNMAICVTADSVSVYREEMYYDCVLRPYMKIEKLERVETVAAAEAA